MVMYFCAFYALCGRLFNYILYEHLSAILHTHKILAHKPDDTMSENTHTNLSASIKTNVKIATVNNTFLVSPEIQKIYYLFSINWRGIYKYW